MGHVAAVTVGVKAKLHHFHTGKAGVSKQLHHILSKHPQVLSNNGGVRVHLKHLVKQLHPRSGQPLAHLGSLCLGVHRPVAGKGAEVVNAYRVIGGQRVTQARKPPAVAVFFHSRPIVQGIAPQLTVLAKVIRRHTGHFFRL